MGRFLYNNTILQHGLSVTFREIFCFSTTRHGGCSKGQYASFNCSPFCGDNPEDVRKNIHLLHSLLPEQIHDLVIPFQTHGTGIAVIDENFCNTDPRRRTDMLHGKDALVTSVPNICLCVSTADCIPVLCYDVQNRVIAAVHAGWRGTQQYIVEKVLAVMKKTYATRPEYVHACIGPGISLKAFEVGEEVYRLFKQNGFNMDRIARMQQKWHIDLWEANRLQLIACGVPDSQIEQAGVCTWEHNCDFYSARRQGVASGRILSGIALL